MIGDEVESWSVKPELAGLGELLTMEFLGHGVDIVDVDRVANLLRQNDDFISGWFTEREVSELASRSDQPTVVAGRIAAKEAVAKALGCGFAGDVSWQDVEVMTTDEGMPIVCLSGGALRAAAALGVSKVLVSISHERSIAVASAIAVGLSTVQGT